MSTRSEDIHRQAIIDLGSNTARLVVYAYEPQEWYRLEDEIRERVRLAEGFGRGSTLSPAAIGRAVNALRMFADFVVGSGLERQVDLIGTSALREAPNRDELLGPIHELGFNVTILSGPEEAALGVEAVANGFSFADAWVVDLGGGSMQLSRMRRRAFKEGGAHPFGMVRTTERFFTDDPPKAAQVRALEEALEAELKPIVKRIKKDSLPLVGMGGTVRNLARAVQRQMGYPLSLLHGYFLEAEPLAALTEKLLTLPAAKRARVPGINGDRADVIAAGAVVFRWLLRRTGRPGLVISGHGLREGAFYRHFLAAPYRVPDVARFSIDQLLSRYPQPRNHTVQVRKLARRLFQELRALHEMGPRAALILDAAAALHDIGTAVSYYRHHKHGAYLLEAVPLAGFDHREQAMIILLVRYHQKGMPKIGDYQQILDPEDEVHLRQLTVCLRLAEFLERSRASRVRDLEVEIKPGLVRLLLLATERPDVEMAETRKQAPLFRAAFHRRLELKAVAG